MENIQNKYGIILDGKMDEPIWDTVPEYSGFRHLTTRGGKPQKPETYFKILAKLGILFQFFVISMIFCFVF